MSDEDCPAALPPSKAEKRSRRDRKEERKRAETLDVAKLIDNFGDRIERAFATGGSSGRLDREALERQLKAERDAHEETKKDLLGLLKGIKKAAAANAMLEIHQGQQNLRLEELKLKYEVVGKVEKALAPVMPRLLSLVPGMKSNADACDDGAQTGKAAFLRLFLKILDEPIALDLVQTFAGPQDWKLITAWAQELGKQTETTAA